MSAASAFSGNRVTGIAFLLWAADVASPEQCTTPFSHAAVAAAFDLEVEIYFTGRAIRLLHPDVAAALHAGSDPRSVYDYMRDAHEQGAKFYACPTALEAQQLSAQHLIAEISGVAGAAAFIARVADRDWATLTY